MLSRKQRADILVYVLKKLYPQCVKRQNLFAEKDASDLVDEIGVHIWVALIRYRRKSYDEALKLAMTTGINRLTSIVRAKLTVIKHGSEAKLVQIPATSGQKKKALARQHDPIWTMDTGLYGNGTRIIDALEAICSAAIMRVGVKKADALVKALMYDWRLKKIDKSQVELMQTLKRSRSGVRKLVASFSEQMRREITPDETISYHLHKTDGKWKNPLE